LSTRPWHRIDIDRCAGKTVDGIVSELQAAGDMEDYTNALVSVYLHDIKPEQSMYIRNTMAAELFKGALSVVTKRILKHADPGGGMHIERGESLEEHFQSFLREKIENDNEFNVVSKKAQYYFDSFERGE
ncbi:MAG TPA: hypothetical protein PK253_11690, partial [Spirochaetota bacterium]|nr:hypothetical protein [Spirochaetota bacterium]